MTYILALAQFLCGAWAGYWIRDLVVRRHFRKLDKEGWRAVKRDAWP